MLPSARVVVDAVLPFGRDSPFGLAARASRASIRLTSSSLAEERTPASPPQHGGARFRRSQHLERSSQLARRAREAQINCRRDRCCRAAPPPLSKVADAASAAGGSDQRRRGAWDDLAGLDSACCTPGRRLQRTYKPSGLTPIPRSPSPSLSSAAIRPCLRPAGYWLKP